MKNLNRFKFQRLFALFSLLTLGCGVSYAGEGPPVAFDAYTVVDGKIILEEINPLGADKTCPDYAICTLLSDPDENGLLQREIFVPEDVAIFDFTNPDNNGVFVEAGTYIQFITVDPGVSGDPKAAAFSELRDSLNFTNEDFIRMDHRQQGIASMQRVIEKTYDAATGKEDRFNYMTNYEFGWAQGGRFNPWVRTVQEMSSIIYDDINCVGSTCAAEEIFNQVHDSRSIADDDYLLSITQRLLLKDNDPTFADARIKFKFVTAEGGTYVPIGNTGQSSTLIDGIQDIGWLAGHKLEAVWVGFTSTDNSGNNPAIDHLFGFNSFANINASLKIQQASFDNPESEIGWINWSSIFGGTETLAANTAVFGAAIQSTPVKYLNSAEAVGDLSGDSSYDIVAVPFDFATLYDNWTVTDGVFTLTETCPLTVIDTLNYCKPSNINESGMFQREIVVNGESYVQTILITDDIAGFKDPNATDKFGADALSFKNESFVKIGGGDDGQGIASKFTLADRGTDDITVVSATFNPTNYGDFLYNTEMNTGWAHARGTSSTLYVKQSLEVLDAIEEDSVSMLETFEMKYGLNDTDKFIKHTSKLGTIKAGIDGFLEPIKFVTVSVGGIYQQTENTSVSPALFPSDPTIEQLIWAKGDSLQATWIGASYTASDFFGDSVIGTTSFLNVATDELRTYTSMDFPPDPDNWYTDPFGDAPVY